jgi:hypothetical protein
VFSIAEFVGLLKHKICIQNNLDLVIVPPPAVKKFILKGNAKKSDMLKSFLDRKIHVIQNINPV